MKMVNYVTNQHLSRRYWESNPNTWTYCVQGYYILPKFIGPSLFIPAEPHPKRPKHTLRINQCTNPTLLRLDCFKCATRPRDGRLNHNDPIVVEIMSREIGAMYRISSRSMYFLVTLLGNKMILAWLGEKTTCICKP